MHARVEWLSRAHVNVDLKQNRLTQQYLAHVQVDSLKSLVHERVVGEYRAHVHVELKKSTVHERVVQHQSQPQKGQNIGLGMAIHLHEGLVSRIFVVVP